MPQFFAPWERFLPHRIRKFDSLQSKKLPRKRPRTDNAPPPNSLGHEIGGGQRSVPSWPTGCPSLGCGSGVGENIANPAHLAVHQTDLDSVRVGGGVGEDVFDDPGRPFSRSLVGFENHFYPQSWSNVAAILSCHNRQVCNLCQSACFREIGQGQRCLLAETSWVPEQLALDFDDPDSCPYFLWSENMTIRELHEVLAGSRGESLRLQYTARILRECSLKDVWHFLKPQDILDSWPLLERRLGRFRRLWTFLLGVWRQHGLL